MDLVSEILELERRVNDAAAVLDNLRRLLKVAHEAAHPFKVGEEVEAYTYVTAKRRWDWQRAKITSITFHPSYVEDQASVEYQVAFLKKNGSWSIKSRYTFQVRKLGTLDAK